MEHLATVTLSSLSQAYIQSELHKQRQQRINSAVYVPPLKHPDHYTNIEDVIMFRVCDRYHVAYSDILSKRRRGNIVKARHAAILMMNKFTQWTIPKIAKKVNLDNSTVFYVIDRQDRNPINYCELERHIAATIPLIDGSHDPALA
jgi:chromosomal replication initiation ATPase DnaA